MTNPITDLPAGSTPTADDHHVAHILLRQATADGGDFHHQLYALVAVLLQGIADAHTGCVDPDCGTCPYLRIHNAMQTEIKRKANT